MAPNFNRYREVSSEVHAILHEYTDLVEPVALDEAYLDVTYNKLDAPRGHRLAKMLKSDIRRRLHLAASAGLAEKLRLARGKRGQVLHRLSRGIDDDPVTPEREAKQLSQERTFAADVHNPREMLDALGELAAQVAGRLRRRRLRGRAVTVKVRYPDFESVTRSHSQALCLEGAEQIRRVAAQLLTRTGAASRGVRLLGVGVTGFDRGQREVRQLDLFGRPGPPDIA